jgi:hypothetical protein
LNQEARDSCFDAFSSREPVPTSLENAPGEADDHPCYSSITVRNAVGPPMTVMATDMTDSLTTLPPQPDG